MRLNLGEEVPVIIHRDNIISDYDQIIDYVERTFTGGTAATAAGGRTGPDRVLWPWEAWGNLGKPTGGHEQGPVAPRRNHKATGRAQMPSRNCIVPDPWGPHRPPPQPLVLLEKNMVQKPPPLELWCYSLLPQEL